MTHTLFTIFQYIILFYLSIQVIYLFFFSVAGKMAKKKSFTPALFYRKIRIFIPGYKEDSVIIATAISALQHNYPTHLFEVVIIADSFSVATLNTLRSLPLTLVEVNVANRTKGKALQLAIEATLHNPVDIVLVLDADNHMSMGFLYAVNNAFEQGYEAVQGHRTAKDPQTAFAFLDACTEEINNHIFRRGHTAVGLPSALIGSGMAFSWPLFISLLENIGDTTGEDKELEIRIVRQRIPIAFLNGSYVYDEKVANAAVFSNQRSRWLATQVEYFKKYFLEGWSQLLKGNIAFFNKVFQTFLLPRVMLIAVLLIWVLLAMFLAPAFIKIISIVLLVLLAAALLMGIPVNWYNKRLLNAILQIPLALFFMLKAMLHIGKAGKQFIHTPHGDNPPLNK